MVDHQPHLLVSRVRFPAGWGTCDFSVYAKASLPVFLLSSSSSFPFPSPFDLSLALIRNDIYKIMTGWSFSFVVPA